MSGSRAITSGKADAGPGRPAYGSASRTSTERPATKSTRRDVSSVGRTGLLGATERELTDRALDVEFDPRHLGEQIDVDAADRAAAEPHVGRHQVERLHQYASILEDERVGERAVLPRGPSEARGDGDHDLRRRGGAHGEFGRPQQRVERGCIDLDRHQRVLAGIIVVESARQALASVDGEIELELPAAATRRI